VLTSKHQDAAPPVRVRLRDWSERAACRRAVGAALLNVALKRKWVVPDLDSRALGVTSLGDEKYWLDLPSCLRIRMTNLRGPGKSFFVSL